MREAHAASVSLPSFGSASPACALPRSRRGYFVGAAVGGAALAVGGYGTLGFAFAALFVGAAIPHLVPLR